MAMVWFYTCVRVCVGGVSWDGVRLRSSYVDGSPHKDSNTRMCICACLCFFKCYILRRIHILTSKVRTFLWDDWGLKLAWLLSEVLTNASVPVTTQIKIQIVWLSLSGSCVGYRFWLLRSSRCSFSETQVFHWDSTRDFSISLQHNKWCPNDTSTVINNSDSL